VLLIVSLHVVQGESTQQCDNATDSVATLPNIFFHHMSLYLKIAIISVSFQGMPTYVFSAAPKHVEQ
jgi:hypothetical protein